MTENNAFVNSLLAIVDSIDTDSTITQCVIDSNSFYNYDNLKIELPSIV